MNVMTPCEEETELPTLQTESVIIWLPTRLMLFRLQSGLAPFWAICCTLESVLESIHIDNAGMPAEAPPMLMVMRQRPGFR